MKARMTISNLSVPVERIKTKGGPSSTGAAGHEFDLAFRVEVKAPLLGKLMADDIECPRLVWNECIEWFRFNAATRQWEFAGKIEGNLFARNPASQTFKPWRESRYTIATDVTNRPPPALRAMTREEDAKKWIARHGFSWNMRIHDIPQMGVLGGSGGGGGQSLLIGDTRRRVIYFDLGFEGHRERARLVQILETQNGKLTIRHLIRGEIEKKTVNELSNLERWRFQLRTSHD
ncbi:hypothetical protein [Paraburkholderia sp. JHI869]|uniref:hypothetical protein n=1 Tax=Paraburkholderia sp. JHI869 TaxID=3112959 RepID=UPI003170AFF0